MFEIMIKHLASDLLYSEYMMLSLDAVFGVISLLRSCLKSDLCNCRLLLWVRYAMHSYLVFLKDRIFFPFFFFSQLRAVVVWLLVNSYRSTLFPLRLEKGGGLGFFYYLFIFHWNIRSLASVE